MHQILVYKNGDLMAKVPCRGKSVKELWNFVDIPYPVKHRIAGFVSEVHGDKSLVEKGYTYSWDWNNA